MKLKRKKKNSRRKFFNQGKNICGKCGSVLVNLRTILDGKPIGQGCPIC